MSKARDGVLLDAYPGCILTCVTCVGVLMISRRRFGVEALRKLGRDLRREECATGVPQAQQHQTVASSSHDCTTFSFVYLPKCFASRV